MKQALINHLKANAELIEALSRHLLLEEAAPLAPAPAPAAPVPPAPAVIDAAAIVAKLNQLTTNRADDGALAFALLADYGVKRVSDIPQESFAGFAGVIDWYITNPDQPHSAVAVGGVA